MSLPDLHQQVRDELGRQETMWRDGKARAEAALAEIEAGNPSLPDHFLSELIRVAFKALDELSHNAHVMSGGTSVELLAKAEERAHEIARFAESIAIIARSQREARERKGP